MHAGDLFKAAACAHIHRTAAKCQQRFPTIMSKSNVNYVRVRFQGNSSRLWDGKVADVPADTLFRTGRWDEAGLELAEVHWPAKGKKGKGKAVKVWLCVVVGESSDDEAEAEVAELSAAKRLETELTSKPSPTTSTGPGIGKQSLLPAALSTSSKPPRGTGRGPRARSSGSGRQQGQAMVIPPTDVAEPAWDWAGKVPVPSPFNTGKLVCLHFTTLLLWLCIVNILFL